MALCNNGVDVEKFFKVLPCSRKSLNRWIYWGRISRNKRVDLVIDNVAMAHKMGYPVDFLICGSDYDGLLDGLKRKVNNLGLERFVRFEPFLEDNELLKELDERGIFITASEHEGFCLTIVEAMAAGLIVVCRDLSPLNSFIVTNKSGFFLKFDGQTTDQTILQSLLKLDQTQVSTISNSAKVSVKKYNWDNASQEFLRHYSEVLSGY